jgi:hypothetical protein
VKRLAALAALLLVVTAPISAGGQLGRGYFKRCPFCLQDYQGYFKYVHDTEFCNGIPVMRWCHVECRNCTACGPAAEGRKREYAEQLAQVRWNTRETP